MGAGLIAAAPKPRPPAPLPPGASSVEAFQNLLLKGDRPALVGGCQEALALGLDDRLRLLRQRLLELHADDHGLEVVLADAKALLTCRAPDGALQVLARVSPAAGAPRQQWLLLQWQAANDGLDHRRAAAALGRLAQGSGGGSAAANLSRLLLPLAEPAAPGEPLPQRPALEMQAEQLEAIGERERAVALLQQPAVDPATTAERLRWAARLLAETGQVERAEALLPEALNQSALGAAWGLSEALLEDQRALQLAQGNGVAAAQTNGRRARLARRLEDAMAQRAVLISGIADASSNPSLAQRLLDRQEPLEGRRGALLDELVTLGEPAGPGAESAADRLARLDLAVRLAQRLDHRERLQDLLAEQQSLALLGDDRWLLDRINRLALQGSAGNPLRELEAIDRRQRELQLDPPVDRSIWDSFTPQRQQRQREALQLQAKAEVRRQQRLGFDPYPGSFALPVLLEDLERLRQARPDQQLQQLAPAYFGQLPRQLPTEEAAKKRRALELALLTAVPDANEREQGQRRFGSLVQQLQRREQLQQQLAKELASAQLAPGAVARQREWLELERQLDPRNSQIKGLAGFGRTEEGLKVLQAIQAQRERFWLLDRWQEAKALRSRRELLEDQLLQGQRLRWQPRAPITAPEQEAVLQTQRWREFRQDPGEASASQLQDLAAHRHQEAVELEALRLRLGRLLTNPAAPASTMQELQQLEQQLRRPISP